MSAVVAVQDFFDKRRGFATAVSFCGISLSIFVTSPLMQFLIDHFGWRGSLFIHAAVMMHGVPAAFLLRTPQQCRSSAKSIKIAEDVEMLKTGCKTHADEKRDLPKKDKTNILRTLANVFDFSLLKNLHFVLFLMVGFTFQIGLNVPLVFQIPRAVSLGSTGQVASLLASSYGIGNAVGRIPIGLISDRVERRILYGVLNLISGIMTLICSFIYAFPFWMVYSAILGFFSGKCYHIRYIGFCSFVCLFNELKIVKYIPER